MTETRETRADGGAEAPAWRWIAGLFVFSRAAIFLAGWLSTYVIQHARYYGEPAHSWDRFIHWDAEWFLRIVRDGYFYAPGRESSVAFMPLYPMAVKALAWLGVPDLLAGFVVTNAAVFAAALLLHRLARLEFGSEAAGRWTVALFLSCPAGIFHATIYSDALFICLSVLAVWWTRRGLWVRACVAAFFMMLTKQVGGLVAVVMLVEYLANHRVPGRPWWTGLRPGVLWLGLVPLALLAYMAYLKVAFNEPLAFVKAQAAWGRELTWPWVAVARVTRHDLFYQSFFIGVMAAVAALTVYMAVRRQRASYVAYVALIWWYTCSSGTLEALPRLTCTAFPIFLALGDLAARRPAIGQALLTAFAMLLAICTVMFTNGYWMT